MVKKIGVDVWDVLVNIGENKRVKSFVWRTGMMVLALIINQGIIFMTDSGLTTGAWVILGLVLGEISKMINNALSGK
jgi:hypothetical protein